MREKFPSNDPLRDMMELVMVTNWYADKYHKIFRNIYRVFRVGYGGCFKGEVFGETSKTTALAGKVVSVEVISGIRLKPM